MPSVSDRLWLTKPPARMSKVSWPKPNLPKQSSIWGPIQPRSCENDAGGYKSEPKLQEKTKATEEKSMRQEANSSWTGWTKSERCSYASVYFCVLRIIVIVILIGINIYIYIATTIFVDGRQT